MDDQTKNLININSLKYKSIKEFFYVYAPEYYVWPLEVHYLCYLINENNELSVELVDDFDSQTDFFYISIYYNDILFSQDGLSIYVNPINDKPFHKHLEFKPRF